MTKLTINVAAEYSATPLGRHSKHGKFSGQRFRDDFLIPALQEYDQIIIDFDGVAGLPSSFLEEAFGGLIRRNAITVSDFFKRVKIQATMPSLMLAHDRISRYVNAARVVA
ncbi:MAG: STAS-like domain-containing protein [Robiginitomaculum sp.]|nr:STAS-like domain-containing protein [Robiginitomaculum sp.]